MKKKIALFVGIMIVLVIGACIYFRPLNLTNTVRKSNTVMITMDTFTVEDGAPNIEMTEPNTLTDAQKEELVALLDGYSYRRTFGTLFSDGSMEGTGERVVHIFLYDDQNVNTADIYLSDNGKISCGNKTYRMKNAKALVEQLAEYTGESTAQKPINYVSTSWMVGYGDVDQLVKDSDLIGLIRVNALEENVDGALPASVYRATVLEGVLGCQEDQEILVYMTGGEKKGEIYEVPSDPLMKKGQEFLIFAKHNEDGTYTALGGPQGRMLYEDGVLNSLKNTSLPHTQNDDTNSEEDDRTINIKDMSWDDMKAQIEAAL